MAIDATSEFETPKSNRKMKKKRVGKRKRSADRRRRRAAQTLRKPLDQETDVFRGALRTSLVSLISPRTNRVLSYNLESSYFSSSLS